MAGERVIELVFARRAHPVTVSDMESIGPVYVSCLERLHGESTRILRKWCRCFFSTLNATKRISAAAIRLPLHGTNPFSERTGNLAFYTYEFSYGLTKELEPALHADTQTDGSGTFYLVGEKFV